MEKISVLMVTHNRAGFIGAAIHSVLEQTHHNFEFIIVDDGSTDETSAIIAGLNDPRLQYHVLPRIGRLSTLRNLAVQKSSCDYIAFIDSDDLWSRDHLELCLRHLQQHKADLVLADCEEFSDTTGKKDPSRGRRLNEMQAVDLSTELLFNNVPLTYGSNLFFKRSLWASGPFNEQLQAGDHDFVLRSVFRGSPAYLPKVLSYIRRHDNNMSSARGIHQVGLKEFDHTLRSLFMEGHLDKKQFYSELAINYRRLLNCSLRERRLRDSFFYLMLFYWNKIRSS